MSAITSQRRSVQARIAVTQRDAPDSPKLAELRKEFEVLKVADALETALDKLQAKGVELDEVHRVRLIGYLDGAITRLGGRPAA